MRPTALDENAGAGASAVRAAAALPRPRRTGSPRIVGVLTDEHRRIEELFTSLQGSPAAAPRPGLAAKVASALGRHLDYEEAHLDPMLRNHLNGGHGLVAKQSHDRRDLAEDLRELRSLPVDDAGFAEVAGRLRIAVGAHIRDQENRIFVLVRGVCARLYPSTEPGTHRSAGGPS